MRSFRLSRQLSLAVAALALSASAFANGFQGATGAPGGNGPGGGGGGGPAIALGVGGAASLTNQIGIATTVGLDVRTGNNTAVGGAGGLGLGGNGFGGTGTGGTAQGGQATIGAGAVQVDASYRAAAAPSYAPVAHGPLKSCRLYAGLGGASRDGSGSAGLPIGNDQVCITDANHELFDRENRRNPGTFTADDYLRASCKVEGMSDTAPCKRLSGREQPPQTALAPSYGPN